MASLSLQQIYDSILLGKEVVVEVLDEGQYNAIRTSLLRKFRKTKESFDSCGLDWHHSTEYVSCKLVKTADEFGMIAKVEMHTKLLPLQDRKTRSVIYRASEI